jgi:hypothetical protein
LLENPYSRVLYHTTNLGTKIEAIVLLFFCTTGSVQAQKTRQQAGHKIEVVLGQICEISTMCINAEKIVVVNSENIFPASSIKESLLGWFSLQGFSRGIAQKSFVSNV